MKKLILCVTLVCAGIMTSCVDKNEEVDSGNPSWLGSSIYETLRHPDQKILTGSFNTYLRLIDDLGYTSTLSRTGSKTVFPANDEAFERFFKHNDWGVKSYNELTDNQKKRLLYSSMIDNALLLSMLPNVSNGGNGVVQGAAIKHATSVSVTDSVTHLYGASQMPVNNSNWAKHYKNGIDVVEDNTRPMMVHFTREYMINNNITTGGAGSDFEILTGSPYTEGVAYIFGDPVVNGGNKTCQNGYVHQLRDVLIMPGNMAQMIRADAETSLFARILGYYSAPYYDAATTNAYNDWAILNHKAVIDSIFSVNYMSLRSRGAKLNTTPDNVVYSDARLLKFDPGWNQYYPANAYNTAIDYSISDMGAMFVPDNKALQNYFVGGAGSYLMDIYGSKPNTVANLPENLDSLQSKQPTVLSSFVNNLMMSSFAASVPSKFTAINNDASENMGMNLSYLKKKADGKYDVKVANNGVVYVLKDMIVPDEYQAVLAPSSSYPDMSVMNWAVQNRDRTYGVYDFKFYLLAMSANYAFFIPDNEAFDAYYVDPTSLGHITPQVLHFSFDKTQNPNLVCESYNYDVETGEISGTKSPKSIASVSSQLLDILNYHTVLLKQGEKLGSNHYYKTKHGGEIYVGGGAKGAVVAGGSQIDNSLAKGTIKEVFAEKNGHAYRISHVIQGATNSVFRTLNEGKYDGVAINEQSRFSEFLNLANALGSDPDILGWAGISAVKNDFGVSPQDRYKIFTSTYGSGKEAVSNACLDYNVKFFNTYNYTLYAPDNAAMAKAYAAGLPRWSEVEALYNDGQNESSADKTKAFAMITAIRNFVRYHFQSTALYADNSIETGTYETMFSDDLGIAQPLTVSGGNGTLTVTDAAGVAHHVKANGPQLTNKMARDLWFNAPRTSASAIKTSSFCAVHEITEPLYYSANKRYDGDFASAKALAHTARVYKQLKVAHKL